MFHIVDVMQGWSRCVGPAIHKPIWLPYDESVSLQELRKKLVDVGKAWMVAARASHEQGLLDQERQLHQVFHLVTHGTHHRGQLLSMISLMGYGQPFEGGDFGGWSNAATHQ